MMVIIGAMNSPKSSLAEEIAIFGELRLRRIRKIGETLQIG